MGWITKADLERAAAADKYHAPPARQRWYRDCRNRLSESMLFKIPAKKILEIGVQSLALNDGSTVIDRRVTPALRAGHKGRIIEARFDNPTLLSETGLHENEFDLAIACQVFEHLEFPSAAWANIKRLTRHATLLTMPWRWGADHAEHHRALRDLAEWTHGDLPTDLRKIGSRVMAWYEWS